MADLRLVTDDHQAEVDRLDEHEAATEIADFLQSTAARMPVDSEVRALALREEARWRVIGWKPIRLGPPPRLPAGRRP